MFANREEFKMPPTASPVKWQKPKISAQQYTVAPALGRTQRGAKILLVACCSQEGSQAALLFGN
jgi:hypothetical protein